MKASDRGRNVKFLGNNFGCVLSKLANKCHYCVIMMDMMSRYVLQTAQRMDYGQKSCLVLGIFIQYNSYLKKAGTQKFA